MLFECGVASLNPTGVFTACKAKNTERVWDHIDWSGAMADAIDDELKPLDKK